MKPIGIRIATVIVAGCVAIGTAGILHSHEPGAEKERIKFWEALAGGADREELLFASDKQSGAWAIAAEAAADEEKGEAPIPETEPAEADPASEGAEPAAAEAQRKLVFIYHSHNRESWLPELKGTGKEKPNEAFDEEVNVTLLGARLKEQLESAGIGAVHSEKDYHSAIKQFNYNHSYAYSKTTVKEALAVHHDLIFLIDIHRDSARRAKTTIEGPDGKSYAKLYFIVGQAHENWKENEALAMRIHEELEETFPGLSKGILTKGTKHGHGEYNQSLSPGSLLIEIGGVDNTLEESYRTIDVLAGVIAKMAKEFGGAVIAESGSAKAGIQHAHSA